MKIVTVLRTGGDFTAGHVWALAAQLENAMGASDFICLSDDPSVPGYEPLRHDWPGWWAKMEMFRLRGPCLYMDLDTIVAGPLVPLLRVAEGCFSLTVLRDFNPNQRELGTGLMAWSGDMSALYRRFAADPEGHIAANSTPAWWGDQGFMERQPEPRVYWQDEAPGMVVSWKKHCPNGRIPAGARVICFHGKPRPWDTPEFAGLYRETA